MMGKQLSFRAFARVRVLCAVCLILFLSACEQQTTTPVTKPVTLIVSGDTAGWLTPCGCASNQSGGLLRRATYIDGIAKSSDVLYADAGGAAGGASEYHKVKFEAILEGEKRMDIAAHNIGASEAALGADYLRDVSRRLGAPLISANVKDAGGGQIVEGHRIVERGGRKTLLVGVLSTRFPSKGIQITDPRQAVLDATSAAKGKYDSAVVLAYMPREELEQFAASMPEVDAVIGGPTGQAVAPRRLGPTLIAAATNKGKFVVELAPSGKTGWEGKVVEIAHTFADDSKQVEGLQNYLAVLSQRDFPASQTALVPPPPANAPADYRIAGSASCQSCHSEDQNTWVHSKHAHAWDTIKAKGFHVDSSCQQCHTTGYGMPGGFESRAATAALVNVGCESCHGPSAAHVAQPTIRTPFQAADQCVRCHDRENSPNFVYPVYWPRIQHGPGLKPVQTPQPHQAAAHP